MSYLLNRNITYVYGKKFEDCCDKRPLPFDFFLPDYNTLIEFDGDQHYRPAFGMESFLSTKKHDKIKNEFAILNGYSIVRIPHTEQGNIETILDKYLQIN